MKTTICIQPMTVIRGFRLSLAGSRGTIGTGGEAACAGARD
jgi:hypothetical protein